MSSSSLFINTFQETLQNAETWLKPISAEMNWDIKQAYHGLRAVLHALRDRLPIEECAHLASHMPMLIRGFFYEGWKPSSLPVKLKTREEFYDYILQRFNANTQLDVERLVNVVCKMLMSKVDPGDIRKVMHNLPVELRQLWPLAA